MDIWINGLHFLFIAVHCLLFSTVLYKPALSQGICRGIGSEITDALEGSNIKQFYLNTAKPAQCNGTISRIDFCYYGFDSTRTSRCTAIMAFYRPEEDGHYVRVSDTITLTTPSALPGFTCASHNLSMEVQVQENDMIGVCIYDVTTSHRALRLVSQMAISDVGYFMMIDSMTSIDCTSGILPSTVGNLQQSGVRRVLHMYADINAVLLPTMPDVPVQTTTTGGPHTSAPGKIGVIGGTVGGTLLLVAVLIVTSTLVIAIVYKIRKRRKRFNLLSLNSERRSVPVRYYRRASFDETSTHTSSNDMYSEPTNENGHSSSIELTDVYQYAYLTSDPHFTSVEQDKATAENDEHFYFVLEGPKCPYSDLLEKNKEEDIYGNMAKYEEPASKVNDLYEQIKTFGMRNIDRSSIEVQNHLGSGEFGSVKSGFWRTRKFEIKIAIKTLNRGSKTKNRVRFLQEAAIMAQFRHPNITSLYGVVSKGEPLMLVVELVEKGDLGRYLKQIKSTSTADNSIMDLPSKLLSFSCQVALGMQYLSGKGFVHRDLAARNVLVSKDDYCKIADFGMSRDLANEKYYVSRGGQIPVKWTAPEAINYKKYSTASDVWSYGCLLYEIWSLGHVPFESTENFEVIDQLERGIRPVPPPGCPRVVYEIMIMCWNPTTSTRPKFREITLALTGRETDILHIPKEAHGSHQQAGDLGSPLKAGESMYIDLQQTYYV